MTTETMPQPSKQPLDTFARDIESVEVQSESRAVVLATIRNTSPIPIGAEMPDYAVKARADGDRYKYVLGKAGDEWKVAELWEWDTSDMEWKKQFPVEDKPRLPYITYFGR